MAPILIDETGIKRLGIMAVIAMMLSFVAGYYLGNQQSGFISNAGTDAPQISVADTTALSEQNKPDEKTKAVAVKQPETSKPASEKISTTKVSVQTEDKTVVASVTDSKVEKHETRSAKVIKTEPTEQKPEQQGADDNHIKYSIQTAVYGQLSRAEKNMNELLDKNIEAYVTDYINKSNKLWYNVRFGYFKDKKSALAALDDYKKSHGGDGYLVNFSAERIVDFDEQKYYEDPMELKSEKKAVSALQPSGSTEQSSSQSADGQKPGELSLTNTNARLR